MHVSVTAIGADRPGMVAAVTEVLFQHACNLEDSRMAILGGHFAMMLVVDPGPTDAATLENALSNVADDLGLTIAIRPIADLAAHTSAGAPHVLSVYGADRPGIVFDVTQALADAKVNIVDLRTHVAGSDPAVYIMLLDLEVPGDPAVLEQRLKELAATRGIDLTLRPTDADTL